MGKINTIVLCAISDPWIKTLHKLRESASVEVVYYVGWQKDVDEQEITESFPGCHFQTVEDAWMGNGFPDIHPLSLDRPTVEKVANEQLNFIRMIDRLDPDSRLPFVLRQTFFYDLLSMWLAVLVEKEIQLIISPSVPHRDFDYALYSAAKILGIEFVMFQMTPFHDSSLLLDSVDATPQYLKAALRNENGRRTLREDIKASIDRVKGIYKDAEPYYMVEQERMDKQYNHALWSTSTILKLTLMPFRYRRRVKTYRLAKGSTPQESRTKASQRMLQDIRHRSYKRGLSKHYSEICSQPSGSKYVFVALHYQPEETSCPTGGPYVDQHLIIRMLVQHLPDDVEILIKEHKSQFNPFLEGESGRDPSFYERMLKISDRIKFVAADSDPFGYIDDAIATVTISGTIGWESVIRGTPSLVFGRAWYEDMPGVYRIYSHEDLSVALKDIDEAGLSATEEEILSYHERLQEFFIEAIHYKDYRLISNRDSLESADNICNGIIKHLTNRGWSFE